MKLLKVIPVVLALALVSCNNDDPTAPTCVTSSTEFRSIYQVLLDSGHTQNDTMGTEIHEYSFYLSEDRRICRFGYDSQPQMMSTPYTIEIVDSVTATQVYSSSHSFYAAGTMLVQASSPVLLQAGVTYTIRRIQTDWGTDTTALYGRVVELAPLSFPLSSGDMTITSSNFYNVGGPSPNYGLPYIDIVFE